MLLHKQMKVGASSHGLHYLHHSSLVIQQAYCGFEGTVTFQSSWSIYLAAYIQVSLKHSLVKM